MVETARQCIFPNDFASATKALETEVGNRIKVSQDLINDLAEEAAALSPQLDEGFKLLDQLLGQKGGNPNFVGEASDTFNPQGRSTINSTKDLANELALPKSPEQAAEDGETVRQDDEKLLESVGIIGLNRALFVPDSSLNIEILRKLYFACGRDFERMQQFLQLERTFFVQNKVRVSRLPATRTPQPLKEIQKTIPFATAADVAYLDNGSPIVLIVAEFLARDIPLGKISVSEGEAVRTSAFHFDFVKNQGADISRYRQLGYSGAELVSILAGVDLPTLRPGTIESDVNAIRTSASDIIAKINFTLQRFNLLSPEFKESTRVELLARIKSLQERHLRVLARNNFEVTVIKDRSSLSTLQAKVQSTPIIRELFEKRQLVKGIALTQEDTQKFGKKLLDNASKAKVNSTTISNAILNQAAREQNSVVISQQTLMQMYAYLLDAGIVLESATNRLTTQVLNQVKNKMSLYGGSEVRRNTTELQQNQAILQGQPSTTTPSGTLVGGVDVNVTFGFDGLNSSARDEASVDKLLTIYPPFLAQTLSTIINALLDVINTLLAGCDLLFQGFESLVKPVKKKIDALLSQFNALTAGAGGTFGSGGILNCAVDFDIALSIPALDGFLQFFENIQAQIGAFIRNIGTWAADMLQQILCLPINLINSVLGQGIQAVLPAGICTLPNISLNADLALSLENIRSVFAFKNAIMRNFDQDLFGISAAIAAVPNKGSQFKAGAGCNNDPVGGFFSSAGVNLGISAGGVL